jgi:predicted DNA-binding transcriptional regulator YafY
MEHIEASEKESSAEHNITEATSSLQNAADTRKKMTIVLHCKNQLKSKCREYLNGHVIKEYDNGDFEYELIVPEDETFWYGVILSFGKNARVLAPIELVERIKKDCTDMIQIYIG